MGQCCHVGVLYLSGLACLAVLGNIGSSFFNSAVPSEKLFRRAISALSRLVCVPSGCLRLCRFVRLFGCVDWCAMVAVAGVSFACCGRLCLFEILWVVVGAFGCVDTLRMSHPNHAIFN